MLAFYKDKAFPFHDNSMRLSSSSWCYYSIKSFWSRKLHSCLWWDTLTCLLLWWMLISIYLSIIHVYGKVSSLKGVRKPKFRAVVFVLSLEFPLASSLISLVLPEATVYVYSMSSDHLTIMMEAIWWYPVTLNIQLPSTLFSLRILGNSLKFNRILALGDLLTLDLFFL